MRYHLVKARGMMVGVRHYRIVLFGHSIGSISVVGVDC
jgi:hypothetical protein